MRGAIAKALMTGAGVSAVFAAVALGAPVSVKPPSISGPPNFNQTLNCNNGTWSGGAVSFDFSWTYSGGGPTIATGSKLHVPRTVIDYAIVCVVTAHDAQGQTTSATSPGVTIAPGIASVRITKATVVHGKVTISGVAGPSAALTRSAAGRPYLVLDRRLNKTTLLQLGDPKVITSRSGHFTLTAHDSLGHHTYVVEFNPVGSSGYDGTSASHQLTVKR
jgi:hypothetical protein